MLDPWPVSLRCLEPRCFVGDPTSLARDNTFTTMVESYVVPILTYGSGSRALKNHKCCDVVLLRASRFYMGVHRLSAIPGIKGDMGWSDCTDRWSVEIIIDREAREIMYLVASVCLSVCLFVRLSVLSRLNKEQ